MKRTDKELEAKFAEKQRFDLLASLAIDALGMSTYLIPALGEGFDLLLAPVISGLIYAVHRTTFGAAFGFVEEIIPFTDIIPTASILWVYRYVFRKKQTRQQFADAFDKKKMIVIPVSE
ncbi:hypothetical protein [Emticicia fluvialis]|uniref:hypothetical protein n=1 Tax=Emticicia fluvialis TaxID=2974474 RepID=UPI002165B416|nr:hypothetical protein [Emticicia fluvialis]